MQRKKLYRHCKIVEWYDTTLHQSGAPSYRTEHAFSLINMLGFVFGMAAAFLIYLWVVNELTYEDYNPDTDRIYRVVEVVRQQTGEITESSSTVLALPEIFKENFPQVEAATAIKYIGEGSMETGEGKSLSGYRVYTDTAFFKFFHLK